jgi:hypothetical protein
MTDPEKPIESSAEEIDEGPPSGEDPMAALVKRSLAEAERARTPAPSILRGVQRRIRKRSRGKFFADGWSTTDARVSHALIAGAMLLILVVAYFALGPVGVQ